MHQRLLLLAIVANMVLLSARWAGASAEGAAVQVDGAKLRLLGPVTEGNLSLYVLCQPGSGDSQRVKTLGRALADGHARVFEMDIPRVNSVLVNNRGPSALFVQGGSVLAGGKQDRCVAFSAIVPSAQTSMPLRTVCLERDRWQGGMDFQMCGVQSSSHIRMAAGTEMQAQVWRQVDREVAGLQGVGIAPARTTKLVIGVTNTRLQATAAKLEARLDAMDADSPAVGIVVVINGSIQSADFYGSAALFNDLRNSLLQGCLAQSMVAPAGPNTAAPTAEAVAAQVESALEGRARSIDLGRQGRRVEIKSKNYTSHRLLYERRYIHTQILAGTNNGPGPQR